MTFGVSEYVKRIIVTELIEKGVENVTSDGFTFSTEKKDFSIPTGLRTKEGRMIYTQP